MMYLYRKKLILISAFSLCFLASTQAKAIDYSFESSYQDDAFGRATSSDVIPDYSASENVRRNKDVSYLPPAYGVFSGEIPTNPSSNYHTQDSKATVQAHSTNAGVYGESSTGDFLSSTSTTATTTDYIANVYIGYNPTSTLQSYEDTATTVPEYSDGSIGRIKISALGINVKVYEGTSTSILSKGVGHFSYTSQWTGNVGLASHNRGSASYFEGIWNLDNGDRVEYTTQYGTRTYEVYAVTKIKDNDTSLLSSTRNNEITLITCVANQSAYRWCVQAREI